MDACAGWPVNNVVVSDERDERDEPSDQVIEQHVHNRLIEYFELTSSFEAQREYERAAPIAHVPYEVIEQWQDWVPHLDLVLATSTVYSADECEALRQFQTVWDATVNAIGDDYPPLALVQDQPAWQELRREAESSLAVFARRGRLPEDREAD
jgi:hypothetical protein